MSYGEMGLPLGRQVKLPSMPYGRQVTLPSVDARGRTWNARLRRPVLCPWSYVDRCSAEAGRFARPKPTGPTRVQAGPLNHPDRFLGPAAPGVAAEGAGTPPGGRTLTTGVRVRHAGHYGTGVLVGAAGLAPAGYSEAAFPAASVPLPPP